MVAWDAMKVKGEPALLKADLMTMRLGLILGAMAFAGTAFAGSTADYIGMLGCFLPPDPRDTGPMSRDRSDCPQALGLTPKTNVLTDLSPGAAKRAA